MNKILILAGLLFFAQAASALELNCGFNTSGAGNFILKVKGNYLLSDATLRNGFLVKRDSAKSYTITSLRQSTNVIRISAVANLQGHVPYNVDTETGDYDRVEFVLNNKDTARDRVTFKVSRFETNLSPIYCD